MSEWTVPFHCGNECPVPDDEECRQVHWCGCCGDCQYCYSEPCYDGCSIHGMQLEPRRVPESECKRFRHDEHCDHFT